MILTVRFRSLKAKNRSKTIPTVGCGGGGEVKIFVDCGCFWCSSGYCLCFCFVSVYFVLEFWLRRRRWLPQRFAFWDAET